MLPENSERRKNQKKLIAKQDIGNVGMELSIKRMHCQRSRKIISEWLVYSVLLSGN